MKSVPVPATEVRVTEPPRERAVTMIIVYKFVRAALSVLGAVALAAMTLGGVTDEATLFMQNIHDHAASKLSLSLSQLVLSGLAPRHLLVFIAALALDSAVLSLEGWALWRNLWWAPWLVAAASGVLLPFELAAIVEHVSPARILLLVVNVLIVAYLLRRTWRRRGTHSVARS